MSEEQNLIIIGSGPAGYTAGIYSARAQLSPLIFSGKEPGGQLVSTTGVENFPGFPDGIEGPELMGFLKKQSQKFGALVLEKEVDRVDFSSRPLKVYSDGVEYLTKSVIIATGASSNWIGLENEARLRGRGVSSCAICDGFFFKGKEVVVVGGGDVALENAIFLSRLAKSVKVIHRRDCLRASEIMQKRAKENQIIEFIWNAEVVDILGGDHVEWVVVKNNKTGEESKIACDGVFVSIGHHPNTEIFKGQISLDEKLGYINVKDGTRTSVDGVFAAGDVVDFKYRQAITAAGTGCMAALDAEKWILGV